MSINKTNLRQVLLGGVGLTLLILIMAGGVTAADTGDTCIEFSFDSAEQCDGSDSHTVYATTNTYASTEPGTIKSIIEVSVPSSFVESGYTIEYSIDSGETVSKPVDNDSVGAVVYNEYRDGSIQYPSIYVTIKNSDGDVVATGTRFTDSAIRTLTENERPASVTSIPTRGEVTQTARRGAEIIDNRQRYVINPEYQTAARFNDGDDVRETFEDSTLPPVTYDDSGFKISGPQGNVESFSNLRDETGFPAVVSHENKKMNIGLAIRGIPEAEFQKLRIDYGLQTENKSQVTQVNLVDQYGEVIDPAMKDAPSRRLDNTIERDSSYFADRKQYENALFEENLNTRNVNYRLTEEEREYLSKNGKIFVTLETDGRSNLLLFRTAVISQSIQNQSKQNFVPDKSKFEESFNRNPGDDQVATFNATYSIEGSTNDEYDSIDVLPNEEIKVSVTIENKGDSRVERDLGVYSLSQRNETLYGESNEPITLDAKRVSVDPQTTKTVAFTFAYRPHEFGFHNLTVIDTTGNNSTRITTKENEAVKNMYVLQPATFEVVDTTTPDGWLVNDNFNSSVKLKNVGDLRGSGTLQGEFQTWTGTARIPTTEGGDARENYRLERDSEGDVTDEKTGGTVTVTFGRDGYDYSPSYPERPQFGDNSLRPNSPFGVNTTYPDGSYDSEKNVSNDSRLTARTFHSFAKPNPLLYTNITDNKTTDKNITIYKLEIVSMTVEDRQINAQEKTWYASGWPYFNTTESPHWEAGRNSSDADILENPTDAFPTYANTQYYYPPINVDENPLNVYVRIQNDGPAKVGTARVKILTNKTGFDGKVVGTGGDRIETAFGSETIEVPVVLPNDEVQDKDNDTYATHRLNVKPRTLPDYIQRNPDSNHPVEDNSTHRNPFTINVNSSLWEDFIFRNISSPDITVNEQCTGHNPSDPSGDTVTCETADEQTLDFEQIHENVGGTIGELEVNADIFATSDPSGGSEYSDWGTVAGTNNGDDSNYYVVQKKSIAPGEKKTFKARDLDFDEPGIYTVKPYPFRANNVTLNSYQNTSYPPENQWLRFKILDVTNPEAHISIIKQSFPCRSGSCTNNDGSKPLTVQQGGTVQFENNSVDNVVIQKLSWKGSISYNGGGTNCPGVYCYSSSGYGSNTSGEKIAHRFDSPGTYTVKLKVYDHDAYGAGAGIDSTGTPNFDTTNVSITVEDDTSDPSVTLKEGTVTHDSDTQDTSTKWHANPSHYSGSEVCFDATQSDSEIGIESDSWTGISSSNASNEECRNWDSSGEKTVKYKAWDFSGRSTEKEVTVTIEHDSSDPTANDASDLDGSDPKACVDASDDETGIWKYEPSQCISDSADAEEPDCGEPKNVDDPPEQSQTVTVYDHHGNTDTATVTVDAYDEETSDPCPTATPTPTDEPTATDGCYVDPKYC